MPAKHHMDNETRIITTIWEGEATDTDFIEALKKYQKDIQTRTEYLHYNEIVNLTKITHNKLSVKGIINIGKTASSTDQYRAKTKIAFIVSSDLMLNFAKLYATYRNFGKKKKDKRQISAFKNENDAVEWLLNKT